MKMVIPTHHPALGALHENLLEAQLKQLGQTSTSSQVCTEIARRLKQGEPRRQDVAAGLGLAERTLQRRLQGESASYQTLLDSTRHELARQYLAEERHTLTDVADLLGYVDSSNFFRACKRWFGVPPAQDARLTVSKARALSQVDMVSKYGLVGRRSEDPRCCCPARCNRFGRRAASPRMQQFRLLRLQGNEEPRIHHSSHS